LLWFQRSAPTSSLFPRRRQRHRAGSRTMTRQSWRSL